MRCCRPFPRELIMVKKPRNQKQKNIYYIFEYKFDIMVSIDLIKSISSSSVVNKRNKIKVDKG